MGNNSAVYFMIRLLIKSLHSIMRTRKEIFTDFLQRLRDWEMPQNFNSTVILPDSSVVNLETNSLNTSCVKSSSRDSQKAA